MAGSRTEKIGTIFKRVQGLLRSGALKEADKPIWYDVYEAFPPKIPPAYERIVPQRTVPKILYPEDIIRVQFYKTYGNPDVADLQNERIKTTCQRFVEQYLQLMKTDIPKENLFAATASALKEQGIRLRTAEELSQPESSSETKAAPVTAPASNAPLSAPSVVSIFGEKTVRSGQEEEQDFIVEEDEDKPPKL
ncbi:hypothetical protein BaRGS_00025044 [Batillaria attramentaria]|uniref:Small ribosomal subunit protein mS23 n=1 Tax=Batillaria attramentaria TaxID=370345 RepID=A0ABD0K9G5_9CAEN